MNVILSGCSETGVILKVVGRVDLVLIWRGEHDLESFGLLTEGGDCE